MKHITVNSQRSGIGRSDARFDVSAIRVGFVSCILTAFAVLAGCGNNQARRAALTEEEIRSLSHAARPSRADELLVSGEVITCRDVFGPSFGQTESDPAFTEALAELARVATLDEFKKLARPQVRQRLNANMTNIILYRRAQRTLGDKVDETLERAAEKELRRFVLEHGGNSAQADEALRARGQNRTTFKQHWKRQALAEYAYSARLPRNRPITYRELVAAYEKMKDEYFTEPGVIQFRLIDIRTARMAAASPDGDPTVAARTLAESLVTRLMMGEEFAALAKEYSHGFRAEFGGLWTPRNPQALAEPYTLLAEAAAKIDVGEIAGPLEVPGRFFIMRLESKKEQGYRPLAEVQDQVERQIMADRNLAALEELDAEITQQIAAADTNDFLDHCLEQWYRSARQSLQTP